MLPIGKGHENDPSYRYRMHAVQLKRVKRKTVLLNLSVICRDLQTFIKNSRLREYLFKYIQMCLHCVGTWQSDQNTGVLKGHFCHQEVQAAINEFIEQFVLCPNETCRKPETVLTVSSSEPLASIPSIATNSDAADATETKTERNDDDDKLLWQQVQLKKQQMRGKGKRGGKAGKRGNKSKFGKKVKNGKKHGKHSKNSQHMALHAKCNVCGWNGEIRSHHAMKEYIIAHPPEYENADSLVSGLKAGTGGEDDLGLTFGSSNMFGAALTFDEIDGMLGGFDANTGNTADTANKDEKNANDGISGITGIAANGLKTPLDTNGTAPEASEDTHAAESGLKHLPSAVGAREVSEDTGRGIERKTDDLDEIVVDGDEELKQRFGGKMDALGVLQAYVQEMKDDNGRERDGKILEKISILMVSLDDSGEFGKGRNKKEWAENGIKMALMGVGCFDSVEKFVESIERNKDVFEGVMQRFGKEMQEGEIEGLFLKVLLKLLIDRNGEGFEVIKQSYKVLEVCYDHGILDADVIVKWYGMRVKDEVRREAILRIKEKVKSFVEWLEQDD